MAYPHFALWALWDTLDWRGRIRQRRRNCWFICKYGNPGCSVREIMNWPLSEVREAADDVAWLLIQEQKNAKAT